MNISDPNPSLLPVALPPIALLVICALLTLLGLWGRSRGYTDLRNEQRWIWRGLESSRLPFLALLGLAIIHFGHECLTIYSQGFQGSFLHRFNDFLVLSVTLAIAWCCYRWVGIIEGHFERYSGEKHSAMSAFLCPFICVCVRAVIPPALVTYLIHRLDVGPEVHSWLDKVPTIGFIVAAGWVLFASMGLAEPVIIQIHGQPEESLENRRLITRIRLLRQIVGVMISLVVTGTILMLFKEARSLGSSLLASAGVATVILGLAAQRTFGTIFAGIQIALTQPIRIGDQVNVENEFGVVEEITLTYVVLRLWDLRRLVLPISYFLDHPFQNWTRSSTNVIGTVLLHVDFHAPIEQLRTHFTSLLKSSPHWDRQSSGMHVTDSNEVSMQLRFIASASNAGECWELRCEIREKMIAFLLKDHPSAFPRSRCDARTVTKWE